MLEDILTSVVLPLFICVVLPVTIVWIVSRTKQHDTNRKAEIMLKAIEAGVPVDLEQLQPKKTPKSIKKDLLEKLNGACITSLMGVALLLIFFFGKEWVITFCSTALWLIAGGVMVAVGIGLFVSFFAGKKMLAKEIEAEEKKLSEQE